MFGFFNIDTNSQYNSPYHNYTAGIHYDFSSKDRHKKDKIINEMELSYSAPPLEPFINTNDQTSDLPAEDLIKTNTENLPSKIGTILYGAWIDPNFKKARVYKIINQHHFTEIEYSLYMEVAKILNNEITDTIAGLLLMVMGRDKPPEVVPKNWPDKVKIMTPRAEYIKEGYGPYNITSKILINLLSSQNPHRSVIRFIEYEFLKTDYPKIRYDAIQTTPERYFIDPAELYTKLNIQREVSQSPLSFDNTADNTITITHYKYNNCNWFKLRSDNFSMAWGDDASLGLNGIHGPIPWVNICSDSIPPTLLLETNFNPQVQWNPTVTPNIFVPGGFCPRNNPTNYISNFVMSFMNNFLEIQLNIYTWNGKEFIKTNGEKALDKKRTTSDIFFIWPDRNGRLPLTNIFNSPLERVADYLNVVECTDETCNDPNCPCKLTKNLRNPKVSLAYFPNKQWGVIAQEFIQSDKLLFLYQGKKYVSENDKNISDNYSFSVYIADSNPLTLDAADMCNTSRFINHSCNDESTRFMQPNCIALNITAAPMDYRIAIFSLRDILPGEELTLNYEFVVKKKTCSCNSCLHQKHPDFQ
ncbi:SET domain containing protein [Trichomonas vaginalis G3]|uniref:SET domain containing protein n=1 Tax=Trichomonas vaginalis (strain ATCC PRA-98 / G3) TaxID=412133 RepID=A2DIU2_TRIV3|nr:histone-lysine N-methyltransferase family [Trichomonas vaginalis G3]EAY19705.1 SET domain containing protein [Trichomonas vaginalis G3]KAI5521275.1 histone-lysine N-methyltransferase family [Trichomonas vaginalis G3]|eukprot:XP_001580691.1 SET domain containing protein [Trichomonas vaginalis G3]